MRVHSSHQEAQGWVIGVDLETAHDEGWCCLDIGVARCLLQLQPPCQGGKEEAAAFFGESKKAQLLLHPSTLPSSG